MPNKSMICTYPVTCPSNWLKWKIEPRSCGIVMLLDSQQHTRIGYNCDTTFKIVL